MMVWQYSAARFGNVELVGMLDMNKRLFVYYGVLSEITRTAPFEGVFGWIPRHIREQLSLRLRSLHRKVSGDGHRSSKIRGHTRLSFSRIP